MIDSQILKWGGVKPLRKLEIALQHNSRELSRDKAEIDKSRGHLNYQLAGKVLATDNYQDAKKLLREAGIVRLRKNGVVAVEVVFSLPIDRRDKDNLAFFEDCLVWLKTSFGGELLTFHVHNDQSQPHAHALILPLVDGRMKGSDIIGGMGVWYQRQQSFEAVVGIKHGLSFNSSYKLDDKQRQQIYRLVYQTLSEINDPLLKSALLNPVRELIRKSPLAFAEVLGIDITRFKSKELKETEKPSKASNDKLSVGLSFGISYREFQSYGLQLH